MEFLRCKEEESELGRYNESQNRKRFKCNKGIEYCFNKRVEAICYMLDFGYMY